MSDRIHIGDTVVDSLSGAGGVVTARAEYMTTGTRILVQPKMHHDGMPRDEFWIDEPRLKRVSSEPRMCGFRPDDSEEDRDDGFRL